MQPRTVYIFRSCDSHYPRMTLVKISYPRHAAGSHHEITPSTYGRFVAIANTGRHRIIITRGDSVSWEMWVQP